MDSAIWIFTGIAVPTLLALGWGAMQMAGAHRTEFRIARVCFWASGLIPAVALYYWLSQQTFPVWPYVGITLGSAVLIGTLIGALLQWVNERQTAYPPDSSTMASIAEAHVPKPVIHYHPSPNVNRPRLVLFDQGVSINTDNQVCFSFTVKNIGPVSVKRADFTFVIQTTRLAKPPVVQHEPTSQPIIEGTVRQIRYSFPKVDPGSAYIAFYVSYTGEGQETKWDNDPVFLVWRGIKGNTIHLTLEYLRDEEMNKFKDYLRKHELPKPLLKGPEASEEPSLYRNILEGVEARGEKYDEQERLRNEENQRLRQDVLERAADLLNERPRNFLADFNALPLAGAHRLRFNRDLVWLCDKLLEGGHSHPLRELGEWVPERDWLAFIQWVKVRANTDANNGYGYVFAAQEWPARQGYPKPTQPFPSNLVILSLEGVF